MPLYAVLLACAAASAPGDLRARARAIVPGLALFALVGGAYFVARWLYFGDVLPNTFHAKSAFSANHVRRGLAYLRDFDGNAFVLCAVPLVVAGAWSAARRRLVPLLAVPLAVLAIVVVEGGDGLPMYRFVVPAVPFLAALATLGIELAGERLGRTGLALGTGVAAPRRRAVLLPEPRHAAAELRLPAQLRGPGVVGLRAAPWAGRSRPARRWRRCRSAPLGYYSGLPVIDMVGLTDRTIARAKVADMGAGWAGHEKHDGPYVLSRRPEILLLGNVFVDAQPVLPSGDFPPHHVPAILAREQDVVAQPAFERDYEPRHLPVAPGLWLHYFARRDLAPAR